MTTTSLLNQESMEAIEIFINNNRMADVYEVSDAIQYIVMRNQNIMIDYDQCINIALSIM
jgi:hypothetical protein